MERKTLPAREKQIREKGWHLFCPGEGCSARLGIRRGLTVTLEPRYTNAPHPSYPAGTWWKQERSKGWPRARDARKAIRDIERAIEGVAPEALEQVSKDTLKRGDLLDDVGPATGSLTGSAGKRMFADTTEYRNGHVIPLRGDASFLSWGRWLRRPRVTLPPGTHAVVCDRCGGQASIQTPIAGPLRQKP